MEIVIADNYELMSKQAAIAVKKFVQAKKDSLLCTASGDSPTGLYKELVNLVSKDELEISACNFVGLDEWIGMNGSDEGSCRYYLDQQLFHPLKVSGSRISFFDGKANDLKKECKETEYFIQQRGEIDVAILGLGINGHIGMNEPGTSSLSRSHVAHIDPVTQKTGQKYFKEPRQLTSGITLGVATLLESKNIILIVSGRHKAEIVKRMLEEDISEQLPASSLRNHKGLVIYLDKDAASLIDSM